MVGYKMASTLKELCDFYDNLFEEIENKIRTASLIDVSNHKQIWELTFHDMIDCYSAISIISLSRGTSHEMVFYVSRYIQHL